MLKVSRFVYWITAWLFVAGVLLRVFLAGMVVVAARMGWENNGNLSRRFQPYRQRPTNEPV